MLYQSGQLSQTERGVFARFAGSPSGYWSDPVKVWAPGPIGDLFAGVGYGTSMHNGEGPPSGWVNYDDGLSQPDTTQSPPDEQRAKGGGEYAPELVPAWSQAANGIFHLTFGLSLSNPYQVDLFESVLTDGTAGGPPPTLPTGPLQDQRLTNTQFQGINPLQGWSLNGGPFVTTDQCSRHFLSTYGPLGSATMGSMQQTFVPGAHSTTLCASILGGLFNTPRFGSIEPNVSLRLLHNGTIVRESRPTSNNSDPKSCSVAANVPGSVAWDLTEFVGESVTLEIHDSRNDSLGFMLVSGLQQGTAISQAGGCQ